MSVDTTDDGTRLPVRVDNRPPTAQVSDPIPLFDSAKFEHMVRIAKVMGECSLIPDSLAKDKDGAWLPAKTVMANCVLVVNQAVRWNMDPFAVAQCASVVHGRLMWEGKLVQAVIETKLPAIRFKTTYQGTGMDRAIQVSARIDGEVRNVEGTVKDWCTRKKNGEIADAWLRQPDTMLHYRGMRQWARQWAPALMLGVYTDDEMDELQDNRRAEAARVVSRPPAPPEDVQERALVEPAREAAKPRGTRTPPPPPEETHDDVRANEDAGQAQSNAGDVQEATAPTQGSGELSGNPGELASAVVAPAEDPVALDPRQVLSDLEAALAGARSIAEAETIWTDRADVITYLPMRVRQEAQGLYLDKLDSLS